MNFTERINEDIKKAMLAKEKDKLAALRDIKAKLLLEATSGNGEVSEDSAMKIVMKLHKQRIETYDIYIAQNRLDLANEELFQAKIIEEYLPKKLSNDELLMEINKVITETSASSMQDLGKVMGILTKSLAGKADGKIISELVKKELSK